MFTRDEIIFTLSLTVSIGSQGHTARTEVASWPAVTHGSTFSLTATSTDCMDLQSPAVELEYLHK